MKLRDLINENRIYRQNNVKVSMITKLLKELYPEDTPQISNDDGIYIVLDAIQERTYESRRLKQFILIFDKFIDNYKSKKKFYIEYMPKILDVSSPSETETEEQKD